MHVACEGNVGNYYEVAHSDCNIHTHHRAPSKSLANGMCMLWKL